MSRTDNLNVSDVDYESIRSNLKEFLRSQDTLTDYDFEGSAISSIVDLLSYVTHYNAVNANLGVNESFLESSQFRGSVVGHAKQLGYTPRSPSAPSAVIDIQVNNQADAPYSILRGHRFKAKIDNVSYTFVVDDYYESDSNGLFENVRIYQGTYKTEEYLYDSDSSDDLIISDLNADTSLLSVDVYESRFSSKYTTFTRADMLTDIDNESKVYFLSEGYDGYYKIEFGDSVLGVQPLDGSLVKLSYLTTKKEAANGASIFSMTDAIASNSNVSITTKQRARGGQEREMVESIRTNAPLTYAAQNRAVTSRDYEAILRSSFSNLRSVKAWGGENNDPPKYGKVFVSVNPRTADFLTSDEKDYIRNYILRPKMAATIQPEIVDPAFLYIAFELFFKYDPSKTSRTKGQLEGDVKNKIEEFNQNQLDEFGSVFRYSNFLKTIDSTDDAILNSYARVYISRRFVPEVLQKQTYELDYSVDLFKSFGTLPVIRSSTEFSIGNQDKCRFTDVLKNDGTREVIIVTGVEGNESVVQRDVGVIQDNKIILTDFVPSDFEGSEMVIEAVPNTYDIAGSFNTILTIDCNCGRFVVEGYPDEIVNGTNDTGANYRTFDKNV